ncbi:hypothetical protein C1645_731006 [Glomus cerebriforme]|uniref:Copper-fist domain-containing protein n=1 Tax=Glomus cerebriforme TaxID=658196 RepID=A0A397TLS2_9GLOM|nr:hypothetical protein C1645_731006 [Glomus cerebriforme]
MNFSRVFFYSCLFLVIFGFIPLVESKCSCCGGNKHNIRTCPHKDNCPHNQKEVEKAKFPLVKNKCSCCGGNQHNIRTCPHKDNCPRNQKEVEKAKFTISQSDCFFRIEANQFVKKGERIKPSCYCARYGDEKDEQCHGIADMLGGPGNCENCMSCSRKMNNDMKRMENFVKKSDGGVYIVTCDNYKHAKTITQIFEPYGGYPTTTVIFRKSPTNHHDEI